MASSGSFEGGIIKTSQHPNGAYRLVVGWTQTKNTTANTSTITLTMKLVIGKDYSLDVIARESSCTISGAEKRWTAAEVHGGQGEYTLGTVTQTVNHDTDGTRSVTVSVDYFVKAYLNGIYYTSITAASGTIVLDKIDRAVTFDTLNNGTLGTEQNIVVKRTSNSYTHTLYYRDDGNNEVRIGAEKTTATTFSFTPPYTMANKSTTGTSLQMTFVLQTYSGTKRIGGDVIKTVTMAIPNNEDTKPTVSAHTETDWTNAIDTSKGKLERIEIQKKVGAFVQNHSAAKIEITAAGKYGATGATATVSVDGKTYSRAMSGNKATVTTDIFKTAGNRVAKITVTDSRGYTSAETTVNIDVKAYSEPKLNFSINRGFIPSEGVFIEDEVGDAIEIKYTYSMTEIQNVTSATFDCYYKQENSSSYTGWHILDWHNVTEERTAHRSNFSVDSAYNLIMYLSDGISQLKVPTTLSTGFTMLHFSEDGNSLAIGKMSEAPSSAHLFEVGIPTKYTIYGEGKLKTVMEIKAGEISITVTDASGTSKTTTFTTAGWRTA